MFSYEAIEEPRGQQQLPSQLEFMGVKVFECLHYKGQRENRTWASHSDYESSTGTQNSEHLADSYERSGKMQEGEQREHAIEGFVLESQAFAIHSAKVHFVTKSQPGGFVLRRGQHPI